MQKYKRLGQSTSFKRSVIDYSHSRVDLMSTDSVFSANLDIDLLVNASSSVDVKKVTKRRSAIGGL